MRALILAAALAAIPLLASAQTTTCRPAYGGRMVCTTQQPGFGIDFGAQQNPDIAGSYMRGVQQRQQYEAMNAQRLAAEQAQIAQQQAAIAESAHQDLWRQVGAAAAAGNCAEAKQIALVGGDLDLAERVGRLCTPAP